MHMDPIATPEGPTALCIQKELQQDSAITAKVREPSEWVNAFVVVKKTSIVKLRVCLNQRNLNRTIGITISYAGGCDSKIDMSKALQCIRYTLRLLGYKAHQKLFQDHHF